LLRGLSELFEVLSISVNSFGKLLHFMMEGSDGIRANVLRVVVVIGYLLG